MADWTRDMVEERITEAADVLKRMPGLPSQGYFSAWPEIQRSRKELAEAMPTPGRRPRPTISAITRMEETITWNRFLQPEEAHLMWARADGLAWKGICYRFGISRATAHRRWEYALSLIAWRLNGRPENRKRSRSFVVSRVAR
jgi:hypothetical protein